MLKWSYPFGYYIKGDTERQLFEHLQKNLEENADYIQEMLEDNWKVGNSGDDEEGNAGEEQKEELSEAQIKEISK